MCEPGGLEVNAASGPAVSAVLCASEEAVLAGESCLVGFGSLAHDACLVGEAGSSGRTDGASSPGEHGTICCSLQQRMGS